MLKKPSEPKFLIVGNHRCLDFINTQIIEKGRPVDLLTNFSDLVKWLKSAGFLDSAEAKKVLKRWDNKPQGAHTFERARAVRAILREMVEWIKGRSVQQSTIDEINKLLSKRIGYYKLIHLRGEFKAQFHAESNNTIHLIAPIAESASDLLCNGNLSLIKKCENPYCVLYFYDTSKSHTRRWCSMRICGNRSKVTAHYRRHRHTNDK